MQPKVTPYTYFIDYSMGTGESPKSVRCEIITWLAVPGLEYQGYSGQRSILPEVVAVVRTADGRYMSKSLLELRYKEE